QFYLNGFLFILLAKSMPRSTQPTRDEQPFTGGFGKPFTSPIKRSKPKRANPIVLPLGRDLKRLRLQKELDALHAASIQGHDADSNHETTPAASTAPFDAAADSEMSVEDTRAESPFREFPEVVANKSPPRTSPTRTSPRKNPQSLYLRWSLLLPSLVEPYLTYAEATYGTVSGIPLKIDAQCQLRCKLVLTDIGKPMRDPFRKGLGYAMQWYDNLHVSIEEQVESAIVSADKKMQERAKSSSLPSKESKDTPTPVNELSPQPTAQEQVESAIVSADKKLEGSAKSSSLPYKESKDTPTSDNHLSPQSTAQEECARILQRRCPACFGGVTFGRTFNEGGDIQVCVDGNFNHRHLTSSGDCPKFYDPEYFLPKSQIDEVGDRIERARGKKPKKRTPTVPDEAVDECESTHVSGSGSNSKTNMDKFDDSGVMALVCRHDVPLFLANIDTPGEQQKYGVALLTHLFSLIPASATVAALYDVGCVLDRSSQLVILPDGFSLQYDLFSDSITQRLQFATSAMHAYVHQWACQLVYNPRLRVGLGLTDGEGVERLWSRLRKLIGITRTSHRARRIWMLDRQVGLIGLEHRDDLGLWIQRRLTKGVERQGEEAQETLRQIKIPESTLRAQWELQRASQLSIRAHAPVRLKKELNTVLGLQGELDSIGEAIKQIKTEFSRTSSLPKKALSGLTNLQQLQEDLKGQSEALYASLNVHESFPELKGVNIEFVRLLFMARDLKINIRKRAIGSFLEWDKLDQAVGGRTKLHQATRKAIAKRKPALMSAIHKFNGYCKQLKALHKNEWNIPVPKPLPTELASLRESPLLHEDVWIETTEGKLPLWLTDATVREGIRALLKRDRCLEERRRLGLEADNLCRWFGRELCAIQVALNSPSNFSISMNLKHRRDQLLSLKDSWSNSLASAVRFDAHVNTAKSLATIDPSSTPAQAAPLTWITPGAAPLNTQNVCFDEDPEDAGLVEPLITDPFLDDPISHPPYAGDPDDAPELIDLFEESFENQRDGIVSMTAPEVPIRQASPVSPETKPDGVINLMGIVDLTTPGVTVKWTLPVRPCTSILSPLTLLGQTPFSITTTLLQQLQFYTFADFAPARLPRYFYFKDTRIYFDARDIAIMESPTQMLNDGCVNGLASLLQWCLSESTAANSEVAALAALFTTFDLPLIRRNASDGDLWRRVRRTEYWEKRYWILPIHRPSPALHWVVACILPEARRIFLFDSLAEQEPWDSELIDIHRFIERLVLLANQRRHPLHIVTGEGWEAHPTLTMGRRRLYHTAEEVRLAANAKSKKSYYKNKGTVSLRRREDYHKRKAERLNIKQRPNCGPKVVPANVEHGGDLHVDAVPRDNEDNPRHASYWTRRVDRVERRFSTEVGQSPFAFVEGLYSAYVSNRNNEAIFDAIVRFEKLQKHLKIYLHEILQLSGCGPEYKRGQEVVAKVSAVFTSLEDLGMYTTIRDEGMPDFESLHDGKEFLYQTLLSSP
ncbi:hypothetical protein H0H93_013187, partial [Arthromyces matolae]